MDAQNYQLKGNKLNSNDCGSLAIANFKKYKSPGSDQILADPMQGEGKTLVSAIHKLINSIWNKQKLPDQ
jgi:hypothetical protein